MVVVFYQTSYLPVNPYQNWAVLEISRNKQTKTNIVKIDIFYVTTNTNRHPILDRSLYILFLYKKILFPTNLVSK